MSALTLRDGWELLHLLITLIVMSIVLWVALRTLTPLTPTLDEMYVVSAVLLLVTHLIRRRIRATRRPAKRSP